MIRLHSRAFVPVRLAAAFLTSAAVAALTSTSGAMQPQSASKAPSAVRAVALPKLTPGVKKLGSTPLGDDIVRIAPAAAPPVAKPARSANKSPVDLRASITAVGLSDDGKTMIAGGREGQAIVADFETGKVRSRFWIDDNERIELVQPSPDGKMFVARRASANEVEFWGEKGEPFAIVRTEEEVLRAAFSPQGTFVALLTDESAVLFGLADRTIYATLQLRNGMSAIAVSDDEEHVALAGIPFVCVWNVKEDRIVWCRQVAQENIASLAFSPDGKHLAAGDVSGAGFVHLCDMQGNVAAQHASMSAITALAFPSPKRVVFANGESNNLTVLSVPDANPVKTFPHPAAGNAQPIYDRFAFSRNGRRAVWNPGGAATLAELKPWRAD